MRYGVTALDIMTRHPIVASPDDTVFDSVKAMIKKNVGSLPVVKGRKLLGIVTEKDIMKEVVARELDPKKTPLKKIMTKKIHTISPNTDLFEIARIMSDKNIRRLPVVVKGDLYGLVTVKDLLKSEPHAVEVLVDMLQIRGPGIKSAESDEMEGVCESCDNYTDRLKEIDGALVCTRCHDIIERDSR